MSRTWKKLLSLLLVLTMVLSLVVTGYAAEDNSAPNGDGLKLTEVDPSTVNVPRGNQAFEAEKETPAPEFDPDDIVRVSIILTEPSALEKGYAIDDLTSYGARYYRGKLKSAQNGIASRIESKLGEKLDVVWNLTLAMNAISANVRYGDIETIAAMDGVASVEMENLYATMEAQPNTAISTDQLVHATSAWAEGYTGAGSRVAILDTGVETQHLSFDEGAFEYSLQKNAEAAGMSYDEYVESLDLLTADKVAAVASQLNANVRTGGLDTNRSYFSLKVPFGINYVNGAYVVDHSDGKSEHGSHVAGITAANRYVPDGNGGYVEAAKQVYAVGVAPDAQILAMKVFAPSGYTSDGDYMAALEDAIILGCDAANLSLGSAVAGFTFSNGYQDVMDSLTDCGMVVAISAGNASSWANPIFGDALYGDDVSFTTAGSPGTFVNSLCVASADNVGVVGYSVTFNDDQTVYYAETSYANAPLRSIAGTYDYVYIDAFGNPDEYEAINEALPLAGKVVIVNRGDISFSEKGNNALPYEPAAVLIANNQPGTINMDLSNYVGHYPMVSFPLSDAEALKAASQSQTVGNYTVYTGTVEIGNTPGAQMSDSDVGMSSFSSWGVPGSLIMKPEIAAPGGSIWSVNGTTKDSYEIMSGTSMAAPHVAGMAAIMGQYIRENGLLEKTDLTARQLIQSLLMSTATPMKDGNDNYVSVLQQGAGLGSVMAAAKAKAHILMGEDANASYADGKVKVELGEDADRNGSYNYSFTIYNHSDMDLAYTLSADFFTQLAFEDEGDMMLDGSTTPLDVDVSFIYQDPDMAHDVDVDGDTDEDDAQAILEKITGEYPADAAFDEKAADLDGDGTYTSYDAYLLLQLLEDLTVEGTLLVPANDSVDVHVTAKLTDTASLDEDYPEGAYIEGYTYITCVSETSDGELLDSEHSIPVLGYYGNWTDPSMYDHASVTDYLFDTYERIPYMFYGRYIDNGLSFNAGIPAFYTNMLTVKHPGESGEYLLLADPYGLEKEFHPERVAVHSNDVLYKYYYTLIRNASMMATLVLDGEGNLMGLADYKTDGQYGAYHDDAGVWKSFGDYTANVGLTPGKLGAAENDSVTIAEVAIPEYYFMEITGGASGSMTSADDLYAALDMLGHGAMLSTTVTVDDTAPTITAEYNEDKTAVNLTVQDNQYVAALFLLDKDGKELVAEPVTFDDQAAANTVLTYTVPVDEDLQNGFTVLAGDYAGNESAVAVGFDASVATSVEISGDENITVYKNTTKQLTATVYPIILDDRTVDWSSSDESIVTVDANGVVHAVAEGQAIVTAASHKSPGVTDSVTVTVLSGNPIDAYVYGQVTTTAGPMFATIDLSTMEAAPIFGSYDSSKAPADYLGGGADANSSFTGIFGIDSTGNLWDCDIEVDASGNLVMTPYSWGSMSNYPMADAANIPVITLKDEEGNVSYLDNYCLFPTTDGQYLLFLNSEHELDGWGGMSSLGLCALTLADFDSSTGELYYFAVSADGTMKVLLVTPEISGSDVSFSLRNGTIGALSGLNLNDRSALSMTYFVDFDTDKEGNPIMDEETGLPQNYREYLLVADNNEKTIYACDLSALDWNAPEFNFFLVGGLDASNVSSLFNDSYDMLDVYTNATISHLKTMDLSEPMMSQYVDTVEMSRGNESANVPVGGVNSVTADATQYPAVKLDVKAAADDTAPAADETAAAERQVVITEKVDATNGTYEVKYDTEKLTFVKGESDLEHYSVFEEEEGLVKVSFADVDPVTAGETIVTLTFEPIDCEDSDVTVTTTERNDDLGLNEEGDPETIEGIGHDWGQPTWTWSDDLTTATAKFVCANDETHVYEETVKVEKKVTAATCEKDGLIVYLATVTGPDGEVYTTTKEETIPATGHDWGEPTWTWSDDRSTATATFVCKNCGEKKVVNAEVTKTTDANGKTTYTAKVTGPDGKEYTDTVGESVKTGDPVNLGLYFTLVGISAAAAFVLIMARKKRNAR